MDETNNTEDQITSSSDNNKWIAIAVAGILAVVGVKLPITKAGQTNTIEFTPEQSGTFEFYCSVGQHRAQGQVETLIVE